jgi:hypothetical protein
LAGKEGNKCFIHSLFAAFTRQSQEDKRMNIELEAEGDQAAGGGRFSIASKAGLSTASTGR